MARIGLLDIASLTEKVDVHGRALEVRGLTLAGVVSILARFPDVQKLMSGQDVDTGRLLELGPAAVSAVIAAGLGYPGDEEAEAEVAQLDVDTQVSLLGPILRLTMPRGLGPFVEQVNALSGGLTGSAKAPATSSPKPRKS